jgi:hypothetical protein
MLVLRVKRRGRGGKAGQFTQNIVLDGEFYTLTELIDIVDDAIYNETQATFRTIENDAFTLDMARRTEPTIESPNGLPYYTAVSVIEGH